ncbi:SDR family NAD(P)-dependent oxidoreductase [Deinococcus humi]|uniref:NAD(P)-dependent dehydrogenase (Short-subunit alcohol dehydrogenase family) n=1 Tax=Deinococcus humi TaxID=662880 RepID=A0A7W8JYM8_9DEIO|nr:SDR family NAD(P)-dependent oxidoreductase [Deinococcus humi]MBB5365630.1 NAD(P)-dependent dehydrogenase (short-subunit alcohol dehydrogenase family) [Deinococcus humi]GGO36855.1 short-chain dehydrogenase/reductase [Deinococcus humi]
MAEKIWFITGASRGLGRVWAEAALQRGDRVAATARRVADLADLTERYGDAVLSLALDVTAAEQATQAVGQAHAHFGRLDVVLNNAGYTLVGMVEEASDADVHALFDTNVYGMHRVIRAALPLLRSQGSGHLIGVSSTLGIVPRPLIGLYCATKAATESLHESLAAEVKPFGLKVTLIEPGAYATEFGASRKEATALDAYADLRQQVFGRLVNENRGAPRATAQAVLQLVDAETPPLRLILGSESLPEVRTTYAGRLAVWEEWAAVSNAAQGEQKNPAALS